MGENIKDECIELNEEQQKINQDLFKLQVFTTILDRYVDLDLDGILLEAGRVYKALKSW